MNNQVPPGLTEGCLVDDVGSDMKDVKALVEDVGSDMKNVKLN